MDIKEYLVTLARLLKGSAESSWEKPAEVIERLKYLSRELALAKEDLDKEAEKWQHP